MAQESEARTLPFQVAPDDSNQEVLIKALHALFYGYRVNEATDAMVNTLAEIGIHYKISLDDLLAGVRTAYRFHAEQRAQVTADPAAPRGEA